MKIKVQIIIESEDRNTETVEDIALLERGSLQPAGLGMTLAEAKTILAGRDGAGPRTTRLSDANSMSSQRALVSLPSRNVVVRARSCQQC